MPAGRKSKCTKRRITQIARYIAAGNFFEPACRAAGIGVSTAYLWLSEAKSYRDLEEKRALEPKIELPSIDRAKLEFLDAIELAEAQAEVAAVAELRAHGKRSPEALVNFLRRRYPDRWGDRSSESGVENTGMNELVIGLVRSIASRAAEHALPAEFKDLGNEPVEEDEI